MGAWSQAAYCPIESLRLEVRDLALGEIDSEPIIVATSRRKKHLNERTLHQGILHLERSWLVPMAPLGLQGPAGAQL